MNSLPILRGSACVLLAVVALTGCDRPPEPPVTRTWTGPTMGTQYHVTVSGAGGREPNERDVQRCIDRVLARVDRHLSTYSPTSEVTALNGNAATGWIPVSDTLYAVLAAAQRVSVETGGAFDVTVAPLVRLWGFGAGSDEAARAATEPPAAEFVHDATASTGYSWLELGAAPQRAVRKGRAGLEIDLDGIVPGYAVDRISSCLVRANLPQHLVEIGGEVRAVGRRPDGAPWRIAIERPSPGERIAQVGLDLSDLAVSTSGSYRDFRRLADGRVVSHTIDPRTGEPVRHSLASVTVVHPRAALADAYATALMVLGPEEGFALAQRLGLPALFLERIGHSQEFREYATPEFEQLRSAERQASR